MTDVAAQRVAEFEATVREHDDALRGFAYRLVGRDLDDVMQVAYLAAFRALPSFRHDSSVSTWLHRIVYTTALNHVRANRRRLHRDNWSGRRAAATDLATAVSDRLDIARALGQLPVEQRSALLLVDGQGFSYDEAAAVLGVAAGTIASRLSRARAHVRAVLDIGKDDDGSTT